MVSVLCSGFVEYGFEPDEVKPKTILKFNRIFLYFLLLILYMVEICTNYQKIILKLFVLSISLTWKDYWYLHTHGWVNNSSEIRKKHIILELNR
jgi:hypothetical protein